jgi:hypothetical protein
MHSKDTIQGIGIQFAEFDANKRVQYTEVGEMFFPLNTNHLIHVVNIKMVRHLQS